jgi:hypothetical protein
MRVAIAALGLLAACERAEPPAAQPKLPPTAPEPVAPKIIVEDRSHVEHPPPLPPGAAWYRRLTGPEQKDVDWVCRNEREDPCWGALRPLSQNDRYRREGVAALTASRDYERHCTQIMGPRRGCNTPLVMSFDGAPVTFDHDIRPFAFSGAPVATAWPSPATPWLALDRNGDGVIDRGEELFRGFATLAALDDNHDGVIDAHDAAFASLVLWADRNADRRSTPDELTPLADVVTAVTLTSRLDLRCDDGDCEGQRSAAMLRDGRGAIVVDVYLKDR